MGGITFWIYVKTFVEVEVGPHFKTPQWIVAVDFYPWKFKFSPFTCFNG